MFISGKLPTTVVIFIYARLEHSVFSKGIVKVARKSENLDNAVPDGVTGQIRDGVETEFAH
jgi:hypothetical protein